MPLTARHLALTRRITLITFLLAASAWCLLTIFLQILELQLPPGPEMTVYPLLTAVRPPAEDWAAAAKQLETYRLLQAICAILGIIALAVQLVILNRLLTKAVPPSQS